MSMLKVIEVLAESEQSWEDAARRAVTIASTTVRNIKSIYVQNFEASVGEDGIRSFRINAKITFALEPETD